MKFLRKNAIDRRLRREVERALEQEPSLNSAQVDVSASDGIVTLRGEVLTLAEKMMAGLLVSRLVGVNGVANDLVVRLLDAVVPTSTEIARAAVAVLEWNLLVPKKAVTVVVTNGWLTLEGTVDWHYQKHIAGREVRSVKGVRGVTNEIVVRPRAAAGQLVDAIRFPAKEYIH